MQTDKWDMGAVILFADRASLVNPAFALDVNNISGVYSICQRLDGVPLAIELAAAWMDNFSLSELLAELDQQLELTARLTDLPERHHSLRTSLDWSWGLLEVDHRQMLMAISTFRGGCFPDAAAAVINVKGMKLRGGLARLIDKSWLYTRDFEGQTRFYLRDAATREYAFEKLEKTREKGANSIYEQAVMEHAQYFSELIKLEGERQHGHGQLEAFQRFCLEKQNIYEALDTLLNRLKQADISEQLVKSLLYITRWLWEFLDVTSDYLELVNRYQVLKDATRQATGQQQIQLWARLGCARGQCRLGNFDAARSDVNAATAHSEVMGDRYAQALSLGILGIVECMQGNFDEARGLFNESLAIKREIGDLHGISSVLSNLGIVEYSQGNLDAAREPFVESLSINHKIGNRAGIAMSLINLGTLEYSQGNYSAAREQYSESLAIKREIANPISICESTASIGCLLVTIFGSTPVSEGGDIKSTCAEVGVICLYGARHHATQLNFTLDPMEGNLLEQGLAIIEHPDRLAPCRTRASQGPG